MNLLPNQPTIAANARFANDPNAGINLPHSVAYYEVIGFNPPWICYYAQLNNQLVGACAIKGSPKKGRIEIAYETFEPFQNKGIGSQICQELVRLALQTDPSVVITTRTLPELNYSTRILAKNAFVKTSDEIDEDGTAVWEWEYQG